MCAGVKFRSSVGVRAMVMVVVVVMVRDFLGYS